MKGVPKQPTDDVRRVAAFLQRIAAGNPLDHMQTVEIKTGVGDLTRVYVAFIADLEFDQPPAIECGRRQDGTLLCRPRNGCDDCPLRDLEVPVQQGLGPGSVAL